jgi:hypothetical protein
MLARVTEIVTITQTIAEIENTSVAVTLVVVLFFILFVFLGYCFCLFLIRQGLQG